MDDIKGIKLFMVCIILTALLAAAVWQATSKEFWYAGQHDNLCEYPQACKCYERFIKE